MKRMKILILAATTQLGAWVFVAGEPAPESFLRRTAGQVQAAGWTGGAKDDVPAAPRIDPKSTSPVSEEEKKSLDGIVRIAETVGVATETERRVYQSIGRMLGLQPLVDGETITIKDVRKDERGMDSIFIRRRPPPAPVEIIFAHGIREDGKLNAYFYVTSADGTLNKVVYKEKGSNPVTLAPQQAVASYNEAVKFWKKWEQDYQRNLPMGDK